MMPEDGFSSRLRWAREATLGPRRVTIDYLSPTLAVLAAWLGPDASTQVRAALWTLAVACRALGTAGLLLLLPEVAQESLASPRAAAALAWEAERLGLTLLVVRDPEEASRAILATEQGGAAPWADDEVL